MSLAPPTSESSSPSAATNRQPGTEERESVTESRWNPRLLALISLSVVPFWIIPLTHLASGPTATGFYQYELPYYVANGRSAFARGNGLSYPNPYDPAADAPAIYAHWFPWTLGLLTEVVGWEPGETLLVVGLITALAFAAATLRLVECRLQEERPSDAPREVARAFLLAMWGGGVLVLAGLLFPSRLLQGWGEQALRFDPGQGMWFLNWGRNALFPTEALYHAIVAVCWVAEIRRHHRQANVCLLLLATTHPWSGLQLLLTIAAWRFFRWVVALFSPPPPMLSDRSPDPRERISSITPATDPDCVRRLGEVVLLLAAFLTYYKLWLPSFASHAQLERVWQLDWSLPTVSALLAYGLLAVPAVIVIRRGWSQCSWSRSTEFLCCAMLVSLGLAFHDRLIRPVQPLHFTRGYLWMPLFLLGLPVIQEWLGRLRAHAGMIAVVGLLALVWLDNAAFCGIHAQRQWSRQDGFHLDRDDRALCLFLASESVRGRVVMTESAELNYLLPTYAAVRPWLGHHFNTPEYPRRSAIWERCFADGVVADVVPADVELLIVRRSTDESALSAAHWRPLACPNAEWRVWQRASANIDGVAHQH